MLYYTFVSLVFILGNISIHAEMWSDLIQNSLKHPTSLLLQNTPNAQILQKKQEDLLKEITAQFHNRQKLITLYGHALLAKELTSLSHQDDLLQAIESNPEFSKSLRQRGFELSHYVRGSFDSDMGKLTSYQKLFYDNTAKSQLLLSFLKGEGPIKSQGALKEIKSKYGLPQKSFLNPNTSHKRLSEILKSSPLLRGYLHELPGMVDAVLAYETGILSKEEFQNQILVNLFHSGPSQGYWELLGTHLLPLSFKNLGQPKALKEIFQHTLFEVRHSLPQYGSPTTFESFLSTFFDRMSQGTKGGYLKIDNEIGGDPIHNVQSLLLGSNIPWTIEQIKKIQTLSRNSLYLTQEQKKLIGHLCVEGVKYLEKYKEKVAAHIKLIDIPGSSLLRGTFIQKTHLNFTLTYGRPRYGLNTQHTNSSLNEVKAREFLQKRLALLLEEIEKEIGDPLHNYHWQ